MKKKLIAMFMGMTLAVGAVACGSSPAPAEPQPAAESGDASQDSESTADASKEESKESSDDTKETEAEADTGEEASGAPQFMSTTSYYFERDDSGKVDDFLCRGHAERLLLTDETKEAYPEFAEKFVEYMSGRIVNANGLKDQYTEENKEARADIKEVTEDSFIYEADVEEDQYLRRVDDKYVSLLSGLTTYAGGAHGYTGFDAVNYDLATGEELALKDVIPDEDKFAELLEKKLLEDYTIDEFLIMDEAAGLKGNIMPFIKAEYEPENVDPSEPGAQTHLGWVLDPDGVLIFFNAYDIAPFSTGTVTALIPYDSGIVDEKFIPEGEISYICGLPKYLSIKTRVSGGEAADVFDTWSNHMNDDYTSDEFESYEVSYKDKKETVKDDFFDVKQYMLCKGDKRFILADMSSYNDYHYMYAIPLTGDGPGKSNLLSCDSVGGYYNSKEQTYFINCLTDTSKMTMGTRMNILSTYTGLKTYSLNDDGTVSSDDKYFETEGTIEITSKADIEVGILDDDDNVTGNETLPKGTKYTIFRTDGEKIVDTTTDDGKKVRFTLEKDADTFQHKINGVDEYDLFEELYYAG